MKTKLISWDDLETPGPCQEEASSPRGGSISSVLLSRVKCLPQLPKPGACLANVELGRPCLASEVARPSCCPGKKLLIGLGSAIAISLMVLLLLWHYKCIVIDHYCEGNSEVLSPLFKSPLRKGA